MNDPKKQKSIFSPLTGPEASYLVYSKATTFRTSVSIYIPNSPYQKLKEGIGRLDAPARLRTGLEESRESNLERSLRLTRKNIKGYILCNEFELFVTFTFKTDRYDVERCKTKVTNWLKNQRRRNGTFEYLMVPEFHKDGKAIHFHGLLKGYQGDIKPSINKKTGKQIVKKGRKAFQLSGYTLGHNNVQYIDKDIDSQTKTGFYLQKYITKEMTTFFGKSRYKASRELKKPNTEDNPRKFYEHLKPDREYDVENGKIIEFNVGKYSLVDRYIEAHQWR